MGVVVDIPFVKICFRTIGIVKAKLIIAEGFLFAAGRSQPGAGKGREDQGQGQYGKKD
jgi:hypothetical protein